MTLATEPELQALHSASPVYLQDTFDMSEEDKEGAQIQNYLK